MPVRIERHELGRNRNEPGDGFRYFFRRGTAGTGGRAEWFEVTEVFEGVQAKEIEAFMRIENGGEAGFDFDPIAFVDGLSTGIPSRAAQQRAADKVIDAIERKLSKASYDGMWREHGYGTLIVGLPLWFAAQPINPLRPENVIDNFMTRVQLGLKPYARRLRRKRCPFWRIVVVWSMSVESTREWCRKAKLDVYDDPAYRSMMSLPAKHGTMMPVLLEVMGKLDDVEPGPEGPTRATQSVFCVIRKKKRRADLVRLPPAVEELRRVMEENGKRSRDKLFERIRWRAKVQLLQILCFIRVHGLVGLERWLSAKLSPRRRLARYALRRRAQRLYRASQRRPSKGPGAHSPGSWSVVAPRRLRPDRTKVIQASQSSGCKVASRGRPGRDFVNPTPPENRSP